MAARATVRNTASNSITATRVAGSEPLKISTPRNPFSQPPAAGFISSALRDQDDVRASEGKRIGHHRARRRDALGLERDVVERASRVGLLEEGGRREQAVFQGVHGDGELERAGAAEEVA